MGVPGTDASGDTLPELSPDMLDLALNVGCGNESLFEFFWKAGEEELSGKGASEGV